MSGAQLPRIELYDQSVFLPDIYALPLQADLVVLSACQTSLGTQQAGEGVMSLARAFAQAGSACVVSSLWTVNDRSTAQLFANFYEKIKAGVSVSTALRQAKLGYLTDSNIPTSMQSPYFWAGLSMVGADRTLPPPDTHFGWWVFGVTTILLLIGWALWRLRRRPR
jgi:CHAT domain-containing protein